MAIAYLARKRQSTDRVAPVMRVLIDHGKAQHGRLFGLGDGVLHGKQQQRVLVGRDTNENALVHGTFAMQKATECRGGDGVGQDSRAPG